MPFKSSASYWSKKVHDQCFALAMASDVSSVLVILFTRQLEGFEGSRGPDHKTELTDNKTALYGAKNTRIV
jgi:hypothetical protein